jgi:hypothetical protein
MRTPSLTDDQGDDAAKLYRAGLSIGAIALLLGCGETPVRTALRSRRVTMRPGAQYRKRPRTVPT